LFTKAASDEFCVKVARRDGPDMEPLSDHELSRLINDWHHRLDMHAPVETLLVLLADDDLKICLPEQTIRSEHDFRRWYDDATRRFFDESREVKQLSITPAGERAVIKMVVNWQARIWNPPEARSKWIDFEIYQTWVVQRSPRSAQLVISTYIIEAVKPMLGSDIPEGMQL
jgi:hypothetical protein